MDRKLNEQEFEDEDTTNASSNVFSGLPQLKFEITADNICTGENRNTVDFESGGNI